MKTKLILKQSDPTDSNVASSLLWANKTFGCIVSNDISSAVDPSVMAVITDDEQVLTDAITRFTVVILLTHTGTLQEFWDTPKPGVSHSRSKKLHSHVKTLSVITDSIISAGGFTSGSRRFGFNRIDSDYDFIIDTSMIHVLSPVLGSRINFLGGGYDSIISGTNNGWLYEMTTDNGELVQVLALPTLEFYEQKENNESVDAMLASLPIDKLNDLTHLKVNAPYNKEIGFGTIFFKCLLWLSNKPLYTFTNVERYSKILQVLTRGKTTRLGYDHYDTWGKDFIMEMWFIIYNVKIQRTML